MIIRPLGGADAAEVRGQYCHVVDLYPTLLSMCSIDVPTVIDGVDQMSVDGIDLSPVVTDAAHPEVRTTQYYELEGSRAIYRDGWKAVTNHVYQGQVSERELVLGSHDVATDHWHLIHTPTDFAEIHDVGAEYPDVLAGLVELWWYEAGRNQVLPVVDTVDGRHSVADRRWATPVARATLLPGSRLFHTGVPVLHRTDFRITARMKSHSPVGEGVLAEMGDWNGGWVFYVRGGVASWVMNHFGDELFGLHAAIPGEVERLEVAFVTADVGGSLSLSADGEPCGQIELPVHIPPIWTPSGGFLYVGRGWGFPVDGTYRNPWVYSGTLDDVTIDTTRPAAPPGYLAERVMRATD
jgi:arylsulfatase